MNRNSLIILLFSLIIIKTTLASAATNLFYGSATITEPTDIATIDLAFALDVADGIIQHNTSYIILEKTMLFPPAYMDGQLVFIDGQKIGPRLNGSYALDTFTIISDEFTDLVGSREVTRQITLDQATVEKDGQYISGVYTETVSGLLPEDIIIGGEFVLFKPIPITTPTVTNTNGDECIDLDEIRSGGNDPLLMEFRDVSEAQSIQDGSGGIPLCMTIPEDGLPGDESTDETLKRALQEFYDTQD